MQEEAGMVGQHTYNDVGIVVLYFFNVIFFVCVYYIKWTCIVCFSAGHVPLIYPRSSRREGARAVQGLAYVHSSVPSIDQLIV